MAHIRKVIRDDIVTSLTGLASTGSRVYTSRVYPMDSSKLPGIAIYTNSENSEYATIGLPRTIMRTVDVNVEVYVKGVAGHDDSLDQICAEIEAALYSDVTRGGYAKDTKIMSFESQYSGDGDQPVVTGVLLVQVMYITTEGAPTS